MNSIWANLRKHGVSYALGAMSVDSWLNSRRQLYQNRYMQASLEAGMTREEALKKSAQLAEQTLENLKYNMRTINAKIEAAVIEKNNHATNITEVENQLKDTNILPQVKEELLQKLDYYRTCYRSAVQKNNEGIKEMNEICSIDQDISNSSFSELFNNFIDSYKEIIDTFSSEQLVILLNLIGYSTILMILTSISLLLMGDHLINYFELEKR